MNKRRRTSSVASRGVDDEDEPQQAEPTRKRKRLDPMEIVQLVYDVIRNHKKDDGSLLCDAFIRAPKRRQEPSYYEVVTNPIDLLKVQQKIKTDEYENVEQLQADIELLVNNTKAFYKRQSPEYKDATELMDLFLSTKNKLVDNGKSSDEGSADSKGKILLKVGKLAKKSDQSGQPQTPTLSARQLRLEEREREQREREQREKEREEDGGGGGGENAGEEELNMCEELFAAVMTATDPSTNDNRPLHTMFQLLPSVKRYPKYYEVIESPIDLRTIARKLQAAEYTCLADMDRDLQLMTRNACAFNEPGSQIYKDAKTLKKIISSRRIEIEHGKVAREGKTSERIRNKRLRGSQSLSAITAALPSDDSEEEEEEEEDGGGEGDAEEENNPRWQLFQAVKNATSPQGALLSEPFWKLPSKRYYPDYYKEIRNAISLMQIGKKLKRGDYGTVSEVAGDMNIMFENAKKYNRPDSKLYKDAVKLQKVMQSKVQELLECDHQYSDSDEEEGVGGGGKRGGRGGGVSTPHRCITRGKYMHNIPLKRRLYSLCKCLIDYVCEDGRQPMLMFMEKPSKKLYPDYYEVIENPIDMLTIEANIKAEKYTNQDEILNDFKLMFRNCRQYNEEQSMIYEDAIRLERVLMEKVKELGPEQAANPATNTATPQSAPPQKKINKIVKQAVDSTPRTMTKTKRLTTAHNTLLSPSVSLSDKPLPPPATLQKMRTLYNTLRDYRDPRGRQLSLIFLRLPSKIEYPDYYEVIKRPINLETISHKLKTNAYEGLDEIVADFVLMFDNACKYNEPDSQIYKDALMLQRVCLQTKLQLREDEEAVPDVISAVQELLTSLFTAVYNHQDEEGRCFSDSMAELPEHDEVEGKRQRALSLDLIKRRLDGMQYRRLDLFQEDLFSCLERARRLSPAADSQVFEDSVELQSFFIRQRDELCRNGDLLHSPALNYTLMDLSAAVDATRMRKQQQQKEEEEGKEGEKEEKEEAEEEPVDEEAETRSSEDGAKSVDGGVSVRGTADNAMSFNQQVYRIGDFVYAEAKERGMEPMLLNIQRLWTSVDGQQMLYANQFYRPRETYHVTTRKFLEKEVFKTEQHVALPLNKVVGRCCVLSVKDYFRAKPTAFDDKDIYVCESRYSSKARAFKKIKNWPSSLSNNYKLEPREKVLEPIRNMSVFRERVEKHKEEIAELEEQEKLVIKEKPNVPLETNNELNVVYYEQYNHKGIVIKTGDCVYLKADGKQAIAQIDTIWTNVNGQAFIRGPWMLLPKDLRNCAMRIFYKQEIFLSTVEDTIPVDTVVGKCAVLEHSEYISCRPTEIPEADVYLCESKFDEAKQLFRELPRDGLKKYTHSSAVTQDEIYFFRRLLNPPRVGVTGEVITLPSADRSHSHHHAYMHHYDSINSGSSPVVTKLESEMMLDDSLDGVGGAPSVSSDTGLAGGGASFSSVLATPTSTKKTNKMSGKKLVTGYILYSGDIRKGIASSNPDKGFGEVSRMVGNEWRKLPTSEKIAYEEKAARLNEETTAKFAEQEQQQQMLLAGGAGLSGAGVGGKVGVAGGVGGAGKVTAIGGAAKVETCAVFECAWDSCDHQFEDMVDCIEHAVADSTGHVQQFFAAIPPTDVEYQCQWKTCIRMKKQCAPFPSLHRLARHVKEVHIMKSTGRLIPVDQRSKNYTPSRNKGANRFHPAPVTPAGNMQRGLSSNIISSHARNTPSPHSQNGATFAPQKPVEPLFVTVPPRPQRLLHSDAYVKYIENLSAESRSISNWEKQLRASQLDQSQAAAQIDVAKLPAHWLANGTANHGNVVNALWTLRDYMFRDALGLSKIV